MSTVLTSTFWLKGKMINRNVNNLKAQVLCAYPVGLGLAVLRGGEVTDGGAELIDAGPIGLGKQVTEGVGLTATEKKERINRTG